MTGALHAQESDEGLEAFADEPAHQYLARVICRHLCRTGLPAGAPLPPITDFQAAGTGIPKTLRRALRVLRDARIVERGRDGAPVVSAQLEARMVPLQARFLDAAGIPLPAVAGAARKRLMEEESGDWTGHLGACPMGVVNIDHRFRINGEFFVYSRFFSDAARFGALLTQRYSRGKGTFDRMLGLQYGVVVKRLDHGAIGGGIPLGISLLAQMPVGMPGLTLDLRPFGQRDEPLYFQQLYIPDDRGGHRLQLPDGSLL